MRRSRARSIAVPIFLLVVASIVAIALVLFTVTFRGPPPRPAPLRLETIATALRTGSGLSPSEMQVRLDRTPGPPSPHGQDEIATDTVTALARALRRPPADVRVYAREAQRTPSEIRGDFTAALRLPDGSWRSVETTPPALFTSWHLLTLQMMIVALLILGALAWGVARAISKPLRQLADTAAIARAGAPLGPIPAGGAAEVRDLSRALAQMHGRLSLHAEGRTAMLAAIAHDLGTPLSRLAFRLEALPDDQRTRALGDIDEMRAMIAAALRFARDEAAERQDQRLDLGSLLDALAEDALGQVTVTPGDRIVVRGDPGALRRLFGNLIENAIRYGDSAAISWRIEDDTAQILIDDQGPGFDPALTDRLFEPFVRGDPSRNRETGGTGLGLAIVRSIAEAHRGGVTLEHHAGHGRVRIVLPLA